MSDRIDRAIQKWAKLTDGFVSDWARKQWAKELAARPEGTEKVLQVMGYLVARKERPTLMGVIKYLEEGLPRDWIGRQSMYEHAEDGETYFGLCYQAMQSSDPWGELRKAIDTGMKLAPNVDWSEAIRECEEKMRNKPSQTES